ncbi:MAG: hypothetical protein AAB067_08655, partial [Planctomycetota bacterium]
VMAGGLGHKRYGVILELPFINPSLEAGVPDTRQIRALALDGTQLGILHDSFMLLSNWTPRFVNNAKPRATPLGLYPSFDNCGKSWTFT